MKNQVHSRRITGNNNIQNKRDNQCPKKYITSSIEEKIRKAWKF